MLRGVFHKSIFLFAALMLLEAACCVIDSCGCGHSEGATRYRITGYRLNTATDTNQPVLADRPVRAPQLRLVLTPSHEFISSTRAGFKALMACSPAEPAPTQRILKMEITSNAPFELVTGTLSAGANLNGLFFLTNGPYGEGSLESFLSAPSIDASLYDYVLRLTSSVAKEQTHRFLIRVQLSDNQVFSLETGAVLLQP